MDHCAGVNISPFAPLYPGALVSADIDQRQKIAVWPLVFATEGLKFKDPCPHP